MACRVSQDFQLICPYLASLLPPLEVVFTQVVKLLLPPGAMEVFREFLGSSTIHGVTYISSAKVRLGYHWVTYFSVSC